MAAVLHGECCSLAALEGFQTARRSELRSVGNRSQTGAGQPDLEQRDMDHGRTYIGCWRARIGCEGQFADQPTATDSNVSRRAPDSLRQSERASTIAGSLGAHSLHLD